MYSLAGTVSFDATYANLIRGNPELKKRTIKTFYLLASDPFYPSLNSHKVDTRHYGKKWSSSVTGDIRIIWDFAKNEEKVINLYDIGSHTGKHKVYK